MPTEVELKYTVKSNEWTNNVKKVIHIQQGYLANVSSNGTTTRVRIKDNKEACITIKGPQRLYMAGIVAKPEYEYAIPLEHAIEVLSFCEAVINKKRHLVEDGPYEWEVDVFEGALEGLVVAELEDDEKLEFPPKVLPSFVGNDVSIDPAFLNVTLAFKGMPEALITSPASLNKIDYSN